MISRSLEGIEEDRLRELSVIIEEDEDWRLASLMRRLRQKHTNTANRLSYLIIVPTLRCDLACSYCQVSRASLGAQGFDWTDQTLAWFERFIAEHAAETIKVEFQGGEPTVRPDLLNRIMDLCTANGRKAEFAICTNLTRITPEIESIFSRPDVCISTSLDGPREVMTANRTASDEITDAVFRNFHHVIETYGPEKVSALPTITANTISDPARLIDFYVSMGFQSIFLRPVNYMGFARKQHSDLSRDFAAWESFYRRALDHIIALNEKTYFEEFYLSMMVRSVFADLPNGYVDLRSPSRFASDYCVIDFDGTLYPSDEARMLSRTRTVDLSIGTLGTGFDMAKLELLNGHAISQTHPDCTHCAYLPYCGIDLVDDISRYGRIDLPKQETWFCRRQTSLFDLIFEKIALQDRRYLDVFLKWIYRRNSPPATYELIHD